MRRAPFAPPLLHPVLQGRALKIHSTNKIEPNYFADQRDVDRMIALKGY
jgi:hypothetical protein